MSGREEDAVRQPQAAGRYIAVLGSAITVVILALELYAIWERRKTLLSPTKDLNARISAKSTMALTLVSVTGLIVLVNGALLWYLDWLGKKKSTSATCSFASLSRPCTS